MLIWSWSISDDIFKYLLWVKSGEFEKYHIFILKITCLMLYMDKTKVSPILYLGQEVTSAGIRKTQNDVTVNYE